jgi:hypothetical protein
MAQPILQTLLVYVFDGPLAVARVEERILWRCWSSAYFADVLFSVFLEVLKHQLNINGKACKQKYLFLVATKVQLCIKLVRRT